jgi:hypothetical protein
MFYFAHQQVDGVSLELAEKSIRSFSLKRLTSLDFKTTSSAGQEDKYFVGLDGPQDLKISCIRSSLERVFPHLIISFPKHESFIRYRVRYSFFSTLFLAVLIWGLLERLYEVFVYEESSRHLMEMTVLCAVFVGLTLLEMTLVKRKIKKAITRTTRVN